MLSESLLEDESESESESDSESESEPDCASAFSDALSESSSESDAAEECESVSESKDTSESLSPLGANSSSSSSLSSSSSTSACVKRTALSVFPLRACLFRGLVTDPFPMRNSSGSPFVSRPTVSPPSSDASSSRRRRLRGGIVTAGRFGWRRYGRPKGIPSTRCLPSSEIWWRPQSVRDRTSAVSRGRILEQLLA
jgi:hypothetical protein